MNRLLLLAKLIVGFVLFAANAHAQCALWRLCEYKVSQNNGTVAVDLRGAWPDTCIPRLRSVAIWERSVSIHHTVSTAGGCGFTIWSWRTHADLGPLPVGSYTAYVTSSYLSAPDLIQQLGTFTINVPATPQGGTAASPVPATHPVMIGLLVLLVVRLAASLRSERSKRT